jgi:hypothetical protein
VCLGHERRHQVGERRGGGLLVETIERGLGDRRAERIGLAEVAGRVERFAHHAREDHRLDAAGHDERVEGDRAECQVPHWAFEPAVTRRHTQLGEVLLHRVDDKERDPEARPRLVQEPHHRGGLAEAGVAEHEDVLVGRLCRQACHGSGVGDAEEDVPGATRGGRVLMRAIDVPLDADPGMRVQQRHRQQPHRLFRRHRAVQQELYLGLQAAGPGGRHTWERPNIDEFGSRVREPQLPQRPNPGRIAPEEQSRAVGLGTGDRLHVGRVRLRGKVGGSACGTAVGSAYALPAPFSRSRGRGRHPGRPSDDRGDLGDSGGVRKFLG